MDNELSLAGEWVLHRNPSHEKISVHEDYDSAVSAMFDLHNNGDIIDIGIEPISEFERIEKRLNSRYFQ